jgi:hypothetical protein
VLRPARQGNDQDRQRHREVARGVKGCATAKRPSTPFARCVTTITTSAIYIAATPTLAAAVRIITDANAAAISKQQTKKININT